MEKLLIIVGVIISASIFVVGGLVILEWFLNKLNL